jgi:hypothetical protein
MAALGSYEGVCFQPDAIENVKHSNLDAWVLFSFNVLYATILTTELDLLGLEGDGKFAARSFRNSGSLLSHYRQ